MTDLTDAEIDSICDGYVQNAARVRFLRSMGLTVRQKPNGRPLVNRAHYEIVKGLKTETEKCNVPVPVQVVERAPFEDTPLARWQEMYRQNSRKAQEELGEIVPPTRAEIKAAKAMQAKRAKEARAAIVRFHAARRRVIKLQRTPAWADQEAMRATYQEAVRRSAETGVMHHVDHIIPLQGALVSGLHVEGNLQVITATQNMIKRNRYEVEQ